MKEICPTFCSRAVPAVALALQLCALLACAQTPRGAGATQNETAATPVETANASGESQAGAWRPARYEIKPEDLPPPNQTRSADNPSRIVKQPAGARLQLPPGFSIETYAEGDFEEARWMALAPGGDVFVSDGGAGKIYILRDSDGDGRVGLGYNQHWTRDIVFRPDGQKLYVTVGSKTNASVEPDTMRAAVTEFNPDGTGKRTFATGLRNAVGIAFYPGTQTLFATVNERDELGDDLVPDYLTSVRDGGFYGWPYFYIGPHPDPRVHDAPPDLAQKTITPDLLIQSHSAALGLVFYQGQMFPSDFRGDAFVALHGSWNRSRLTGFKIIRVPFRDGRPAGFYEDFITGWLTDENSRQVWGRPVGLLVLRDGSLLITDDGANKIWRVTYKK
ncbi:MAG: sorbosone dehydrogenase [Acidobacteria bacterium]|nr:MAG: sorbosone dehydrogenase [Acidobacteriota bacterium]